MSNTKIAPSDIKLTDIITAKRGGIDFDTRLINLNDLLSDHITPLFSNISGDPETNVLLKNIFDNIRDLIGDCVSEIQLQHQINAKLIYELQAQGIKIESKELNNELIYLE